MGGGGGGDEVLPLPHPYLWNVFPCELITQIFLYILVKMQFVF